MEETLKAYEIGYLLKNEEEKEAVIAHLKRLGTEVLFEGEVKNIKLTYPINHLTAAYFGYSHFRANTELVSKLNEALKLDQQIIRFLIITPPFAKERNQKPETPPAEPRKTTRSIAEAAEGPTLSNDLLEEKLEEILNK